MPGSSSSAPPRTGRGPAVGKGTGQGLAIAHAFVVQKHRGSIHVESEVGQGTTFIVRLAFEQEVTVAGLAA